MGRMVVCYYFTTIKKKKGRENNTERTGVSTDLLCPNSEGFDPGNAGELLGILSFLLKAMEGE